MKIAVAFRPLPSKTESMSASSDCTVVENVISVLSVEEHITVGVIITCLALTSGVLLVILLLYRCSKRKPTRVEEVRRWYCAKYLD